MPGHQPSPMATSDKPLRNVMLANLSLVAAPFYLDGCQHCIVEGVRSIAATTPLEAWLVKFPSAAALHGDWRQRNGNYISGESNLIKRCKFTLDSSAQLSVNGSYNSVQQSLFTNAGHHTCAQALLIGTPWWVSRDKYIGIGNSVRNSSFVNMSYVGVLNAGQRDTIIRGNHVALGGRLCADVSPIYSYLQTSAGTHIVENWVHDTNHAKWNALGIRGDDKSRNLTIERNVVWNCRTAGIVAKGEGSIVRHNTLFHNANHNNTADDTHRPFPPSIEMASTYDAQDPALARQGTADVCANNIVERGINGDMATGALPAGMVLGNFFARDARKQLRCSVGTGCGASVPDFRPLSDSVLAGSAAAIGGIGGGGEDVGAYSTRETPWVPGCASLECVALLPRPSDTVYEPHADASGWLAPILAE
jgi:hypothetical protein